MPAGLDHSRSMVAQPCFRMQARARKGKGITSLNERIEL
jgi:hypothetical protein